MYSYIFCVIDNLRYVCVFLHLCIDVEKKGYIFESKIGSV